MKIPILSLLILCLCFQGFSQIIENVDYNIEGDIISVTYDLNNFKASAKYNIDLKFINDKGSTVIPESVEGDIELVKGGKNKKIIWNVVKDIQEMEGQYKAVVTITKQETKNHTIFLSPNLPWAPFGARYAYIKKYGCYVSFASDLGLIDGTFQFTGGLVASVARRTNIYLGGGMEILWQEPIGESGVFLKFNNITVDIIGVGINFSDREYCYTKFGVGINF